VHYDTTRDSMHVHFNAGSDVPVDNWTSVDTALVCTVVRATAYCSLAHRVPNILLLLLLRQEHIATAVTETHWDVALRSIDTVSRVRILSEPRVWQ
jgi:hypothetical protein